MIRKTTIMVLGLALSSYLTAQESLNTLVNTLKERINLSAYIQTGYTYNSALKSDNTFDIKRIIFMADGKITDRWSCYFMYDFYPNALQEVYTDYRFAPALTLRAGQFKTPYTLENLLSPTSVELINCYTLPVCYLAAINGSDKLCSANGGRDIGMMVYGDLFDQYVHYKLAVMNGQGINVRDRNSQKDVIGYLTVNPYKWLTVGGTFATGTGHSVAIDEVNGIAANSNYSRQRWSVGASLTGRGMSLRTEYLAGKDGSVNSNGYYATGCIQLVRNFDAVASYEYLNKNTDIGDKQSNYMAGVQYWFYPKCRLQLQYTRNEPTLAEGFNLVQAQLQVRF